jgi:S-(hydroxymethyl)glutathione dehydrogenase/alcohol dehydrogenase
MKACVLHEAPGRLAVEDLTIDAPGPDEVLVRVEASGLCHSDLHVVDGALPLAVPLPAVPGHEAAGTVEAVGSDVTEFAVGDRVVSCLSVFCGVCRECVVGRTWLCERRMQLGRTPGQTPRLQMGDAPISVMAGLGAFAEQMLVHRNSVVKVPSELAPEFAALLGCAVITGVGSVINGARVEPGSTVAVIGCGGVGLNVVQGAALAGASRIVAVDLHDAKLELARQFGATDVVNAGTADPVGTVQELTSGGVDYAFEVIGLAATAAQAVAMIRPGRTAYLVGVPAAGSMIELPGTALAMQAKGLQGLFMGSNRFKRDIPLLAELALQGRLKLEELVAARIGLDDVNDGYDRMREGTEARSVIVF